MTNRNAQSSAFGWEFQSNLALYFAAKDLKQLQKVKVEGPTEDIELFYEDGSSTYIQAKSKLDPHNDVNTNSHLKDAIKTLIDASNKTKYSWLYYGSNIHNPFVYKEFGRLFFNGATDHSFNELPEKIKDKIRKYAYEASKKEKISMSKFDFNRLRILTVPFYGEDDETRYRYIKQRIELFLESLGLKTPQISSVFIYYQLLFAQNPSKKLVIQKKDLAWPIIIYSLDTKNDDFYEEFSLNISEEDEIENIYSDFIEKKTLDFTFFNEISNHFKNFVENKEYINRRNIATEFIEKYHLHYSQKLFFDMVDDTSKSVTSLILWKIIKKSRVILRLQKEMGL